MANISTRPLQLKTKPRYNPWVSRGLYLLFFAVLVYAVNAWRTMSVPEQAPDFSGVLISGSERTGQLMTLASFRARHPGQPVALHFWAEWCPVCRVEEGSITALLDDGDMAILTIATRSGDGDAVFATLKERELDWPVILDADGRIAGAYRLPGVPAFVVIDAEGKVHSADMGYTSGPGMRLRLWLAGLAAG
jgi:thiol-disulfide isomerase/thioredoxin